MRFFGWIVGLAAVAGLVFYVWHFNKKVDDAAAANNGAVCLITMQLNDELWNAYLQEGLTGTLTPEMQAQAKQFDDEARAVITGLEEMSGSMCQLKVSQMPPMQPGRIKVNLTYFKPEPTLP